MPSHAGRDRDPEIDARVLAVACRHLSAYGYEAMSLSAVAAEAETTRQALYRRWSSKAELAAAAVEGLGDVGDLAVRGPAFADLVAELTDFQRSVSHHGRLSLVGTMLQTTTDPDVRVQYRTRVVAPRRRRIRTILERGVTEGLLDADADLDVAVTMCTGSWYGRALTGARPPARWPYRTAALVWRALGGVPPPP